MEVALVCSTCELSTPIMAGVFSHKVLPTFRSYGSTAAMARGDSSSVGCSASPSTDVLQPWLRTRELRGSQAVLVGGRLQQQLNGVAGFGGSVNVLRGFENLDSWRFVDWPRYGVKRVLTAPSCSGGGDGGMQPRNTHPERRPNKTHISPPGLGQFRPPPSTYVPEYQETEEEKNNAAARKNLLVQKVTDGQSSWQERAALIKELQQLGVTSEDLYSLTFVPIVKQLEIVVAAQVYDSLVQSGAHADVLRSFDDSTTTLLYALRTLSFGQRRSAAEYVITNNLSVEEAQKLAWAIKDHERRPLGRKGFTPAPGDCLAFMYHRQAIENQDSEQRNNLVELGRKVAVTETAKQRFSEFS